MITQSRPAFNSNDLVSGLSRGPNRITNRVTMPHAQSITFAGREIAVMTTRESNSEDLFARPASAHAARDASVLHIRFRRIAPPSNLEVTSVQAPVAQPDRALPSEGRGRRFESCRVRHSVPRIQDAANHGNPLFGL